MNPDSRCLLTVLFQARDTGDTLSLEGKSEATRSLELPRG